jgi:hypothetical protein
MVQHLCVIQPLLDMRLFHCKKVNVKKWNKNCITKQPFILYFLITQRKVIAKYDDKAFIAPTFITKQTYSLMNFMRSVIADMGFLGLKRPCSSGGRSGSHLKDFSKPNLIILLQVIKLFQLTKTPTFFALDWMVLALPDNLSRFILTRSSDWQFCVFD